MLQNYLTVALRTLRRHKLFTFINVLGLGLGMACCLLILLFIRHETSYDRHVPDADRVYQVIYHVTTGDDLGAVPPPIAPQMPDYFSEVETVARAFSGAVTVQPGESTTSFEEDRAFFVDSTFTRIFPLTVLTGTAATLGAPGQVVLTADAARRFFGTADATGRTLTAEGDYTFTVAGVIEPFPATSHLHPDLLFGYDDMFRIQGPEAEQAMRHNLSINWVISHSHTYVKLKPGASAANVNDRFDAFVAAHAPEQLQVGQRFSLLPIRDIHLAAPDVALQPEPQGDIQLVYLFAAIAFLTLLLPCFNFVNLATAQSIGRTQEIGVRQALGAQPQQLFAQFLGESLVICSLAFALALVLTAAALPAFSDLLQRDLTLSALADPLVLAGFVGVLVVTGLLGGSYPAYLIARTQIVEALRRTGTSAPRGGFALRRVLVAVQFGISITLIAGTLLIYQQLNYLVDRPLGFEQEQVVTVPLYSQNMNTMFGGTRGSMRERLNTFEAELAQHPRIHGSTLSRGTPGTGTVYRMTVPEGRPADEQTFVPALAVDYDFPAFYGLDLVAGRFFDRDRGTDHTDAFIINESAVTAFGWASPDDALGRTINLEGKEAAVVGVVRDFHYESLLTAIGPMLMEVNVPAFQTLSIRLDADAAEETLAFVEARWAEFFPAQAFAFEFLDARIEQQYQLQQRLGGLVGWFAILGVVISCLGAYGLVMFSTRQRLREIGIRKVLGASVPSLLTLLYRELTVLFGVGLLLAAPAVWFAGRWWLDDFSYRITLGPGVLLLGGGIMLLLAWLTISYQALKATRVNPVECLRSE